MSKWVKFIVIGGILFVLIFLGISTYNTYQKPLKDGNKYIYTKKDGTMLIGGMKSDKEKIDSFAEDMTREDDFNKHWDLLDKSNELRKKGDYKGAIEYRLESLEYAKGIGQKFQVKLGLAKLYKMDKQYDLAIKEYEWCIEYSNRPDVIEKLKTEIDAIKKLQAEAFPN